MKVQMRTPASTIWRTLPGATVKDVGEGRWELTARCPAPLRGNEIEGSAFRVGNRVAENVVLTKRSPKTSVAPGEVFVVKMALGEPAASE